jgi:nucleoside-specific outer membrane channel protein Tsx
MIERKKTARAGAALALAALSLGASAAEWSDTSIGARYGTRFREPGNPEDISKRIVSFTHVSGYKYGTNFLNVDLLDSDGTDKHAQEAYVVYRHTFDLGKLTGGNYKVGPVSSVGITAGFDWNTKNDPGYGSRKRMLVLGPTFGIGIPAGFLNAGVYLLHESNQPAATGFDRYTYDVHPMLGLVWGVPIGAGFSFEGFLNYIASKGSDEFGAGTKPETNFDAAIMYDLSPHVGAAKNTFKVGFEYQYWRNKFGNDPRLLPGTVAKTPMIRAEYHF